VLTILRTDHRLRSIRPLLLRMIDPDSASGPALSRALGACTSNRNEIFISYHRVDASPDAARLAIDLSEQYGPGRVFIDYASLPGAEKLQRIISIASACRVLIVLISPSFTERVAMEGSYVQRELLAAVAGGATLLPMMIDAPMPRAGDLPEALRFLPDHNGIFLDRTRWELTLESVESVVDDALEISRLVPLPFGMRHR
jgi:hypothetical protein